MENESVSTVYLATGAGNHLTVYKEMKTYSKHNVHMFMCTDIIGCYSSLTLYHKQFSNLEFCLGISPVASART